MRTRIMLLAGLLMLLVLGLADVAQAVSPAQSSRGGLPVAHDARGTKLPGLLAGTGSSDFIVRPALMVISGDGSLVIGRIPGKGGRSIHWTSWTSRQGRGVGTLWIDDMIGGEASGTRHPHLAIITVSRVRHGRFTRMSVRFRGGDKVWNKGDKLYIEKYSLRGSGSWYGWY